MKRNLLLLAVVFFVSSAVLQGCSIQVNSTPDTAKNTQAAASKSAPVSSPGETAGKEADFTAAPSQPAAPSQTDGNGNTNAVSANGPLALYPAYVEMPQSFSIKLDCRTSPTGSPVAWTVADPDVATVDENGKVSGIKAGETTVTVALKSDPSVTARCGIRVVDTDETDFAVWDTPQTNPPGVFPPKTPSDGASVLSQIEAGRDAKPKEQPAGDENIPVIINTDGQKELDFNWDDFQKILEKDYVWTFHMQDQDISECYYMGTQPAYLDQYYLFIDGTKKGGDTPYGTYSVKGRFIVWYEFLPGFVDPQGYRSIWGYDNGTVSFTMTLTQKGKNKGKFQITWVEATQWQDIINYGLGQSDPSKDPFTPIPPQNWIDYTVEEGISGKNYIVAIPLDKFANPGMSVKKEGNSLFFLGQVTKTIVWRRLK